MPARYYIETLAPGETRTIDGAEAHHMTNVMRLKPGDTVALFDGLGNTTEAVLSQVSKREVTVSIGEICHHPPPPPPFVTAAIALPKGDRSRLIIEKMTELGVHSVIPLITSRSVVKSGSKGLERLRRYIIESCKQCERNYVMTIAEEMPFASLLEAQQIDQRSDTLTTIKILLDPDASESLNQIAFVASRDSLEAILFAVGPEGGWTDEERQRAEAHGWQLRKMGDLVLRTETAAIAAATLCQLGW